MTYIALNRDVTSQNKTKKYRIDAATSMRAAAFNKCFIFYEKSDTHYSIITFIKCYHKQWVVLKYLPM